MVAAMKIYELTGSMAGTDKTASTVRFKLADDQTIDSNNPITIPSGNHSNHSYHKKLRMYCATAPGTQIDNLLMYSDGGNGFGTGISVIASNHGVTFSANATAELVGSKNLFDFTSGAPMNIDGTDTAAITTTGYGGDIVALQMLVASTASPGELTDETITFSYDEI